MILIQIKSSIFAMILSGRYFAERDLFTFRKQSFINFYRWIVTVMPFKRDSS